MSPAQTTSLRVAILTPSWPEGGAPNGIVSYVSALRPALLEQGASVRLLAAESRGELGSDAIDLSTLLQTYESRPVLWKLLRSMDPYGAFTKQQADRIAMALGSSSASPVDILEMEESFGWAYKVKKRLDVPVVVRLHGPRFLTGPAVGAEQDAGFRRRVREEGKAIAAADGVTAPSRDVLERTREHYGLELSAAEVIPHPQRALPEQDAWRRKECDPNLILFVGRFDLNKGGDVVIDAFARLRERIPDARLCFVGPDRGLQQGGGESTSLAGYAASRIPGGLEGDAIDWQGQLPPERLPGLRKRAMVTVAPSRYETFGYTAVEAMAQGCPLIAAEAGGLAEIVQHERNGLLVPPGDPEALAAAMERVLTGAGLAERMGDQAAEDCSKRYNPASLAGRTLAFYRGVIGRTQGAVRA